MTTRKMRAFVIGLFLLIAATPAFAGNWVVNTVDDNDDTMCDALHCSLREAINAANSSAGGDVITFNITTPPNAIGGWAIQLGPTALPMLSDDDIFIDGFSQPGSNGTITSDRPGVIESPTAACPVLTFQKPNIAVDANKAALASLTFPGLAGDVMSIAGHVSDIRIRGLAIYDGFGAFSGSVGNAVAAHAGPGLNRKVESMFIGLLMDGTMPPLVERNFGGGVQQYSNKNGNIIGRLNVYDSYVGHNGLGGVVGERPFSVMEIERNETFENGWNSVAHDGIDINGILSTVRCNLSHTNKNLAAPNGSGGHGIEIGSTNADANLDNNVVEYNSAYNNMAGAGIIARAGARGNLIQKNVVHHNLVGINVNREGQTPTNRNQIFTNSTYMNIGLGIDLQAADLAPWMGAPDHITLNDHCDVDGGAPDGSPLNDKSNDLQNYPDLTSATLVGGELFVGGVLDSTPLRDYVIQFFATPGPNGVDREGQYFLGQIIVTTDANCVAPFNRALTPEGPVADGDVITATATRLFHEPGTVSEGETPAADWWSTSEYSAGRLVNEVRPEGKVTGGGYIQPSEPVCVAPCVSATDTSANYGFVAQYKRRGDEPEGHINFVWNEAKVHFSSTDYFALLVNREPSGNGDARWQGEGKLNNKLGYCFKANVHDMGEPAQSGNPLTTDSFRIKIWRQTDPECAVEGPAIYDNGSDVVETPVSAGNIQIHHP